MRPDIWFLQGYGVWAKERGSNCDQTVKKKGHDVLANSRQTENDPIVQAQRHLADSDFFLRLVYISAEVRVLQIPLLGPMYKCFGKQQNKNQ